MSVTIRSPINIAIIKYWGKKDVELNTSLNDSISCCLEMMVEEEEEQSSDFHRSTNKIYTDTTVTFSKNDSDSLSLNGSSPKELDGRHQKVLRAIRERYPVPPLTISSINYFPTSAGLASSASGMSALVRGIFVLLGIEDDDSVFEATSARIASGSSCRSLGGAWVHWSVLDDLPHTLYQKGQKMTELRCMIFITSPHKKTISSKEGMQLSVESSSFLKKKVLHNAKRVVELKGILEREDYPSLFRLMITESDELHYICSQDTIPPLMYLNEQSRKIIKVVKEDLSPSLAGYTFDAGPNAFVFCRLNDMSVVRKKIEEACGDFEDVVYCSVGNGATVLNK